MAKIVYLMRHGQTLFNELKKVQGWCDSPLTELGKEQARDKQDNIFNHKVSSLVRPMHRLKSGLVIL